MFDVFFNYWKQISGLTTYPLIIYILYRLFKLHSQNRDDISVVFIGRVKEEVEQDGEVNIRGCPADRLDRHDENIRCWFWKNEYRNVF
jgi:hypothetical protein